MKNIYGWANARDYQCKSLTLASPIDRLNYLAAMLCTLGHVIHLNQDLAQPDHVRNDEHALGWHSWIEKYGEDVYLNKLEKNNPGQFFPIGLGHGWPYWREHGFTKLLAFWDRGLYQGDASSLDADAAPDPGTAKLGLAEYSSGNFLGEDAIYTEFFKPGKLHYFPHPFFIRSDTAEYYFEQTIDGQLLLFPVEFVKENGVWKILQF